MTKPIAVGDLVVVVRGPYCCRNPKMNGTIFKVSRITTITAGSCCYCNAQRGTRQDIAIDSGHEWGYFLDRLKRIPPLSELEGQRTQEDIREPA